MGKKKSSGALSHEEIWDDSALVRSWDDAVQEYKTYHSIHARGEDVEQVLKRAEDEGYDGTGELMETAENATAQSRNDEADGKAENEAQQSTAAPASQPAAAAAAAAAPAMPSAMLGQVQDPALKNLMMSWYFAGYYTGLYEGRQQAARNTNMATTNTD